MKILLTFFAIASFTTVFSQITINSNFPSTMSSGSSIDADVKINKGTVGNFAKYQMDVPVGYVISVIDAKGGNFTFENQRAKIVWVSVPSEPEFTIKLKVQANSDATNPGTFSQKFYYLENNEKKEVEATPAIITIGEGGTIASNTPVEIKPTETKPVEPVVTETKPVEPVVTETKPVETKPIESAPVKKTTTPIVTDAGMTFKVQIGAYTIQPNKSKFSGAGNVNVDLINGMYKVTTGNFKTLEDAIKHRDELKSKGFSGFIAKYKNGVRIN
jgi:cell division septation protein DedD